MYWDRARFFPGRLLAAWRRYPGQRRRFAEVPAGPPVLLTGAYRSGTSWAAAMLASPGVWYVYEPCNPNRGAWHEEYSYVRSDRVRHPTDDIMKRVLKGGCRQWLHLPGTESPLMPLRLLPQGRPRRVLIKDPMTSLMAERLSVKFGLQCLVMFRHPAGFVASITERGWPTVKLLRQFLACESLMHDWLAPHRRAIERGAAAEGTASAAVLHGCLNRVLWGYAGRNRSMRPLIYEELCEDPRERFRSLCLELGLPYDESVRARHSELCLTEAPGDGRYRPHQIRRDSRKAAFRWRDVLGPDDIRTVREIWRRFEIPLYEADSLW